ncbi:hypothetical protein GCM10023194_12620 [Planotetraspora phitsanulokensis]|uniref:Uncharacterized protein n=1 Tax=Planotetraspora phitsanulokensis TaxID=575192 RepID=A0A8J3UDJ9_9ACTN|nr:hypothetical protein [Planotetraspora phitsanulokensis]GII41356.1 hypothetical protein Pph01_63590 [Planotetraspora phitsanulokensis]
MTRVTVETLVSAENRARLEHMETTATEALRIMEEVLAIVQSVPHDTSWTSYEDWDAAVADIRDHVERLRLGDLSRRSDLRLLFAPTGRLQELAIGNGWSGRYLTLAGRFDELSLA